MSTRRRAGEQSRERILRNAEQIMLEDGYAAVTYRSVAARTGVTPGLVQYYFPVLDELFVTLLRESTDRVVERLERSSETEHPLRAIWAYARDRDGTRLLLEFMALAHHRKDIGPLLGEGGERVRQAQLRSLQRALAHHDLAGREIPPAALLFLLASVPRMLQMEESFGTTAGHAEITALIEALLDEAEPLG